MTTAIRYVMWVAKHLEWFEFHTGEARTLRREIRSWMYGSQSDDEARRLQERFKKLFSDDVLMDTLCPLFRRETERQFVVEQREQHLKEMPGCAITGRTIRAYGGPEQTWSKGQMFEQKLMFQLKQDKDWMFRMTKSLREAAAAEKRWYQNNKMGLWTILSILCFAFGAVSAALLLAVLLRSFVYSGEYEAAVAAAFPVTYWRLGDSFAVIPAAALGALVLFCVKCKRFYYSGVASLLWFKEVKRENKARTAFFDRLLQRISHTGLEQTVRQLCAAAAEINGRGDNFLEKEDGSPAYIGDKGVRQLVQLPLPGIRPNWKERERFYLCLPAKGIRKPFWYMTAGLILLIMVYGVMEDPAGIRAIWMFAQRL